MRILIITGGSISQDFARDFVRENHFERIIAVDGGLKFADMLVGEAKLPLTDIVGDFDTIAPEILEKYKTMPEGPKIHEYIPEKDNTDTDIALRLAINMCHEADCSCDKDFKNPKKADCFLDDESGDNSEMGGKNEIYILGATGTRLDHVLANITMLLMPYHAGIDAYIQDANNRICLLHGTKKICKRDQFGKYISLIPLTPLLGGITLTGVKYPLDNHRISQGDSLCVSNEITEDMATLTVTEGIAVLLETRD